MINIKKYILSLLQLKRYLVVSLIYFLSFSVYPQSTNPERTFLLGFTENTFDNINSRDLEAATELLTQEIISNSGKKWNSETIIYYGMDQVVTDLTKSKITALAMSTQEYLLIKDKFIMKPAVVPEYGGYYMDNIILLVNNSSKINSLNDLKNKKIVVQEHKKGLLSNIWLTTILNENNLESSELFFSEYIKENESNKSIMNLFFGKVDACITTKATFNTMSDLNPQIGRSLRILEESDPLVFAVICIFPGTLTQDDIELISYTMETLHEQTAGNQILKIFRINKLIKFNEDYLQNTKKMITKFNRINLNYN